MALQIELWQTEDGATFATQKKAMEHEVTMAEQAAIEEYLDGLEPWTRGQRVRADTFIRGFVAWRKDRVTFRGIPEEDMPALGGKHD